MPNFQCHLHRCDITFTLADNEPLLQSAFAEGYELPYRCASGYCGACKLRLVAGRVKMEHAGGISRGEIAQGYILTCCAIPLTDIEIDTGTS